MDVAYVQFEAPAIAAHNGNDKNIHKHFVTGHVRQKAAEAEQIPETASSDQMATFVNCAFGDKRITDQPYTVTTIEKTCAAVHKLIAAKKKPIAPSINAIRLESTEALVL